MPAGSREHDLTPFNDLIALVQPDGYTQHIAQQLVHAVPSVGVGLALGQNQRQQVPPVFWLIKSRLSA